jgi:hypothetical protein
VSVEEAFGKLVGRQASPEERARLYRLRDALGLQDNDAFWSIVMALEHYDSFFRAYPAQLAEETRRAIEQARGAFAAAASQEAARIERTLSERVAQTSVEIARKLADKPVGLHRITTAMAAIVAFGALCVSAGYNLAKADRPFWAQSETLDGAERVLGVVVSLPAGWMIFALLVPAAAYGAMSGWNLVRDEACDWPQKTMGWLLVAVSVAGCIGSALLIARVT